MPVLPPKSARPLGFVLLMVLLAPLSGCMGAAVQVANLMGMNMVPAEYAGLKGKRVAVVCVSPDSSYGPIDTGSQLAVELERYLGKHVRRISFVPRGDVMGWLDVHSGGLIDYARMGQSLDAERVLVVELASFSYHDNVTFYQGKANFRVTVFDVETGERVYDDDDPDKSFPTNGGYHLTDMSEEKFKRAFLAYLASDIGRRFHANDLPTQFVKQPYIH